MAKQPWYMPFFWPLGHVTKALRLSVTSQALEPLKALEGLGVVARWVWGCWLNMRCGQEKKFMDPKRQSRIVLMIPQATFPVMFSLSKVHTVLSTLGHTGPLALWSP